jgi:quercetin dioxygenase-like cupin family protein
MPVMRAEDVAKREVDDRAAQGTFIQEFVTARDGAPNFALRVFELQPGGHTPYHAHAWEHENYVLEGEGVLVNPDGSTTSLKPGDAAFVPPNQKHQYRNTGSSVFRFICCIPVQEVCAPPKLPDKR